MLGSAATYDFPFGGGKTHCALARTHDVTSCLRRPEGAKIEPRETSVTTGNRRQVQFSHKLDLCPSTFTLESEVLELKL